MNETENTPSLIHAGEEDWIFQIKTKTFSFLDGILNNNNHSLLLQDLLSVIEPNCLTNLYQLNITLLFGSETRFFLNQTPPFFFS